MNDDVRTFEDTYYGDPVYEGVAINNAGSGEVKMFDGPLGRRTRLQKRGRFSRGRDEVEHTPRDRSLDPTATRR
jgi:hypothetical protein